MINAANPATNWVANPRIRAATSAAAAVEGQHTIPTDQANTNTETLTLVLKFGGGQAHLITHQPGDLFGRVTNQLPDRTVLRAPHQIHQHPQT